MGTCWKDMLIEGITGTSVKKEKKLFEDDGVDAKNGILFSLILTRVR